MSDWFGEPYDGYAVWHAHFPSGPDEEPLFDAVEDRKGRIFVWGVEGEYVICRCPDRRMAEDVALVLAHGVDYFRNR